MQDPGKPQGGSGSTVIIVIVIVLGLVVLGCAGLCGGLFFVGSRTATTLMEAIAPNGEASDIAVQSQQLREALGDPLSVGPVRNTNFNMKNNEGSANFQFEVSGPQGSATIQASSELKDGNWSLNRLTAQLEDGTELDLLQEWQEKLDKPDESSVNESDSAGSDSTESDSAGADQ